MLEIAAISHAYLKNINNYHSLRDIFADDKNVISLKIINQTIFDKGLVYEKPKTTGGFKKGTISI